MKANENQKTVLVAGASGATGRLLVDQLLKRGFQVRAIVRSPEKLPDFMKNREGLTIIKASILDLSDDEMAAHTKGCYAIASCLGHNLTFKGIYGKPRRLVRDAVRRLCKAAQFHQTTEPVKFVLMNTAGNRNRDLKEPIGLGQRMVIALLRVLLPPHPDNEQAADFLRTQIGQDHSGIAWVVVRPDGLIDEAEPSPYEQHPSPVRNPIFNAGKTSRINVGHFMAALIDEDALWEKWKGQMPVIYNEGFGKEN